MTSVLTTAYKGTVWLITWKTNVFVRSGASRDMPKVAELPTNTTIVEIARNGDWVQHSAGWTLSRAGQNQVMTVLYAAPNENTMYAGRRWRVAWASNVYVRQTTNRESLKVAELAPQQEVVELARDGDWVKHMLGWTLAKAGNNVVLEEVGSSSLSSAALPDTAPAAASSAQVWWKVVWSTAVYVRSGPSRDSPKVGELAPATLIQELAREGDWVRHATGWSLAKAGNNVCLERVVSSGAGQSRTWRCVWSTAVYVRAQPTRDAAKVGEIPPGAKVIELEATGDWIRHSTGWSLTRAGNNICLQYEPSDASVAPRVWRVVWATNCYVRGAPNRESDKVAELPPGTTVIELGLQGDWVRHAKGWTLAKAGNNICMQVVGSADSLGEGQATAATAAGTSASSSSSSSDSSAAATATGVSIGDWDEYRTAAGQLFYYHRITKVTQWSKPESAAEGKQVFNPEMGSLELAKPSIISRNLENESFFG